MLYVENHRYSLRKELLERINKSKAVLENGPIFIPVDYDELEKEIQHKSLEEPNENHAFYDYNEFDDIKNKDLLIFFLRCDCEQDFYMVTLKKEEHYAESESFKGSKFYKYEHVYENGYVESIRNREVYMDVTYDRNGVVSETLPFDGFLEEQEFFDEIQCVCPNCGERNRRVLNRRYTKLYLCETDKLIKVKKYTYEYATKFKKGIFSQNDCRKRLNLAAIPRNVEYFINKDSLNVRMSYVKNGKRNILSANKKFYVEDEFRMGIVKEFINECFLNLINEKATYQKEFLLQKFQEYNYETTSFEFISFLKFYLEVPFAHEFISKTPPHEIHSLVRNLKSKKHYYFYKKMQKCQSGNDLLKLYISKYNKHILKYVQNNKFDSIDKYFFSNRNIYQSIHEFVYGFENKEMIHQFIQKYQFSINFNPLKTKKLIPGNLILKYMSEYDFVSYLIRNNYNLYKANNYYRDTLKMITNLDDVLKVYTDEFLTNLKEANFLKWEVAHDAFEKLKSLEQNKVSNLEKLHDTLSEIERNLALDFEIFTYTKDEKNLEFETDKYQLSLYNTSVELKDDAKYLSICSYSYLKDIKDKRLVLFSLKEKETNTTKMCIEVHSNKIKQAKLRFNKIIETKSDPLYQFLEGWMNQKRLIADTRDLNIQYEEETKQTQEEEFALPF